MGKKEERKRVVLLKKEIHRLYDIVFCSREQKTGTIRNKASEKNGLKVGRSILTIRK